MAVVRENVVEQLGSALVQCSRVVAQGVAYAFDRLESRHPALELRHACYELFLRRPIRHWTLPRNVREIRRDAGELLRKRAQADQLAADDELVDLRGAV